MQVIIEFPYSMWISKNTIRFSFKEEISHPNFSAVQAFNRFLKKQLRHNLVECVASYHTVTAYVKQRIDVDLLRRQWLDSQASTVIDDRTNRLLKIPVCYDEEFALDRQRVMDYTGLSFEDMKMLHMSKSYYVYLIGFLPGFPYLGELDSKLFVPRLEKPRASVSASSVGVGGGQTGIYPVDSPGGWNIIGRTPLELFNVNGNEPFLFELGDEVQFYEITKQQYWEMKSKGV
ncbi:5-oxoprolinase subunit PxpB [Lysinibacillus fusiformis]|uniref:5-oxoprolinase subunit PxpB n=1 Tax=Lysinibacillus fusiformis TaxID=28031 RepID=UPI001EF50943|nr:5-oxoprolinase subunit PxpB [Lysinibacillus fusiformis]